MYLLLVSIANIKKQTRKKTHFYSTLIILKLNETDRNFIDLTQTAEYLFKHSGGQYSALDMAQYVFWTGDEEGVAKAVEEFIRKGLVSIRNTCSCS